MAHAIEQHHAAALFDVHNFFQQRERLGVSQRLHGSHKLLLHLRLWYTEAIRDHPGNHLLQGF